VRGSIEGLTIINYGIDLDGSTLKDDRMPDSAFKEIRNLDLFSRMADESFAALMRGAYVQNFPAQVELITEGDPSDFLHVVLSGSVDLFSAWNGRETSLATVTPISTFILAATIKDAPYLMSARTLEKSRIALIPSQDVRTAFDGTGAMLPLGHQGPEGSEVAHIAGAAGELSSPATATGRWGGVVRS
jgi:hypothetical protein